MNPKGSIGVSYLVEIIQIKKMHGYFYINVQTFNKSKRLLRAELAPGRLSDNTVIMASDLILRKSRF